MRGKYITIDGIPGVGKSTLASKLARELQAAQLPVKLISQPGDLSDITTQNIDRLIKDARYPMQTATEVLLYHAVHARSLETIKADLENGITVIADHSHLSTLVSEYYGRGDLTDYRLATDIIQFASDGLQPDLTIILDAPVSNAKERLSAARLQRLDESYLERIRAGYLWEAKQRNLPVVYATEPTDAVFKAAWDYVARALSTRVETADTSAKSIAEVLAAKPEAVKVDTAPVSAAVGQQATAAKSATTAEATHPDTPQPQLSERTDAAPLTVTNLLASQVAWHRNIVCDERSPQDSAYDKKDTDGHYRYYIPANLKGKVRSQYIRTMNQLFDTYSNAVSNLTVYLETTSGTPKSAQNNQWHEIMRAKARAVLRPLLPAASTVELNVQATVVAYQALCLTLEDSMLVEAHALGQQIMDHVRATGQPHFMEDTPQVERDVDLQQDTVKDLADRFLPVSYSAENDQVTLVNFVPRNELDLVADMLYGYSDLPLRTLRTEAAAWPYQRKLDICTAYLAEVHPNENVLRNLRYTFDVVSDYRTLRNLQRKHAFRDTTHQRLSPRLGYATPAIVESAGLSDTFDDCFDLSLQLYSALQNSGHVVEAQYATLLGHKARWSVSCDAEELFAGPFSGSNERAILTEMRDKISEIHPIVAEAYQAKPVPKTGAAV
jgi:dTMP kinase